MKHLEQHVSAEDQLDLIRRILQSEQFRRSQRSRELLDYIGHQTITQGRHVIREQEIGAAVFGRKVDYDTSIDNIVRVNASDLRRRLERYFTQEGATERIVLEIPRGGGYGLQYYRRTAEPVDVPATMPAADVQQHAPELLDGPVTMPPTRRSWYAREYLPWAFLIVLLPLLAFYCFQAKRLTRDIDALNNQRLPWTASPQVHAFWGRFFDARRETDIITADSSLAMEEELLHRQVSLEEYLNNSYRFSADERQTPEVQNFLRLIRSRNSGSLADFGVGRKVMTMVPRSYPLRFGSARDYVPDAVRNHNLILIGSRAANPWVDLYKDRLTFDITWDSAKARTILINHHPAPGEPIQYQTLSTNGDTTVYSVVALLPNADTGALTLLIAGCDSQGTKAAGDFITSEPGLTKLAAATHGAAFFEAILRSSRIAGTTLKTEVIAVRNDG